MRTLARLALVAVAAPAVLAAQQPDFRWEKALPAGNIVRVHNINGNVTVSPSSSGKVEIVGTRHGSIRNDDITAVVSESSDGIVVCVIHKDGDDSCDDGGYHSHNDDDWNHGSMDLDVRLPANLEVSANSVSGDVSVTGAQGRVRAGSVSGDVKLDKLRATSIHASTVSGSVEATVDALSGSGDLSFKSVSGDVTLELPKDFSADLSMSSVSGRLDTDFPMTLSGRMARRRVEARIGKGGRDLDVSTVSGDVRLRMAK